MLFGLFKNRNSPIVEEIKISDLKDNTKNLCGADKCLLLDHNKHYYFNLLPCASKKCENYPNYNLNIMGEDESIRKFIIPIDGLSKKEAKVRIKEVMKSYKEEIRIMEKTIVINLFSGPGVGKSTICAQIFSELKWAGVNCEMALEFAKDKVWEGSEHVLENQPYIFGKQLHRMYRLNGKVNVIITDSPLLLSIMYDATNNVNFENFVVDKFEEFNNKNYFIKRHKNYKQEGRLQSFDKAKELDSYIYNILVKHNVMFKEVDGNRDLAKTIADEIIEELKTNQDE